MRTTPFIVCGVFTLTLVATLSTSAQAPSRGFIAQTNDPNNAVNTGTKWALLVGINQYVPLEGFDITPLESATKDVANLRALLTDPDRGAFPSENVFVLTDQEATRDAILITFAEIAGKVSENDLFLFFFSGHGYRPTTGNFAGTYLLPYLTNPRALANPRATCIDFDALTAEIREMKADKVVVILDACHAGGVKPKSSRDITEHPNRGFTEAFQNAKGRALLLSSDESQVSWEEPDGGVFTRFLLEALDGKADANNDGTVTFTEVALYVEREVPQYTAKRFNQRQTPIRRYEQGPVTGDIPLALLRKVIEEKRRQQQAEKEFNDRTAAILRAGLKGLSDELREYCLKTVREARDKIVRNEPLSEAEALVAKEVDLYQADKTTVEDFIFRVRVIAEQFGAIRPQRFTLRVAPMPSDAEVRVTGENAPTVVLTPEPSGIYRLERGRYRISVGRAGYQSETRTIELLADAVESVALNPLTGRLELDVTPPDAQVRVEPLSVAAQEAVPRTLSVTSTAIALPVGSYRITAQKEGYEPVSREPVVVEADKTARVTLALRSARFTLRVAPMPSDAKVNVMREDSPTTPLMPEPSGIYRLDRGRYRISVGRAGYQSETRTIELLADRVESVALSPLTGALALNVTPSDAQISVEPLSVAAREAVPRTLSVTSATVVALPVGQYRVTARREGYEPASREPVAIEADRTTRVTLALNAVRTPVARIAYPNAPADVRVWVDNVPTTLPAEVPPGIHRLRIERPDYEAIEYESMLADGENLLTPNWIPLPKPPLSSPPQVPTPGSKGGIWPLAAFGASMIVPGLGQHLQRRHGAGVLMEVLVAGSAAAAVAATLDYNEKRDRYIWINDNLSRSSYTVDQAIRAQELATEAQTRARVAQIALGAAWLINVLDAPRGSSRRSVVFESTPNRVALSFVLASPR